jgi:hypothetical protein
VVPFIKVSQPDCYDFGEPVVQLVKIPSDGLYGWDLRTFVKRAGSQFANEIKDLRLKPGDVPVHLIALGTTEFFGPNRNYDGFKVAACRIYHPAFVKYARWYRDHQNKNKNKSYGFVKHSAYNERMHRVELLVILNSTKEAADRNGGLIADDELQDLNSGKSLDVSMATKVAFDVCSSCGHKAKSRAEYCLGTDEGGLCKDGGLRHRIGSIVDNPDSPVLHADNPEPYFFDISRVPRGADRTARTTGILKAAAAGGITLGGAALAEAWGVMAPLTLDVDDQTAETIKLAEQLAVIERAVEKGKADRWSLAFRLCQEKAGDWTGHDTTLSEALRALADQKILLPLSGFLAISGGDQIKAAAAAQSALHLLPGVHQRLLSSELLPTMIANSPFRAADGVPTMSTRRWAEKLAVDWSISREHADNRVWEAAIYHAPIAPAKPIIKLAAGPADEIARHYAIYQLNFLESVQRADSDFDLTRRLTVVQNHSL